MSRRKLKTRWGRLYGANLYRTIGKVKLRRGLGGRWYFKVNKYDAHVTPRQHHSRGWHVWLRYGMEPLGTVKNLTEAVALATKATGG